MLIFIPFSINEANRSSKKDVEEDTTKTTVSSQENLEASLNSSLDEVLDHFVAQIVEPLCMIEDYIEVNDIIAIYAYVRCYRRR